MEDRQNNAPSHEKARSLAKRLEFGPAPFIVGLVVALVFGWWIFPELLFSRQDQPVQFSHETHLKDASLDCSVCHHLRADGTFDALPSTKDCAVCHSQMLGKSEAERVFFNEYVKKGKEVDWKSTRSSLTTCSSAMPCTRWQPVTTVMSSPSGSFAPRAISTWLPAKSRPCSARTGSPATARTP